MKRVEWRYYREEDWPFILSLHIDQERQLGVQMDLPDLSQRPVISCLVGIVDGKITDCIFAEAQVELCAYSSRGIARKDLSVAVEILTRDAQQYDIRLARAFVPAKALVAKRRPWRKARKPPVKRILDAAGFKEVGQEMVDFYRWIPKKKGG